MPTMPRADAETLFGPYGATLIECVRGAVMDYFEAYTPHLRTIHRPTTRANIVRDHMVERASLAFAGVGGVNLLRKASKGKYTLLSVQGQALLRFKYLGLKKRSRNVKTDTATAFVDNQAIIEGLPPQATRFDVGYSLNALQTAASSVSVSCPTPTGVEYVIDLWIDGPQQETLGLTEITPAAGGAATAITADGTNLGTAQGSDAAN